MAKLIEHLPQYYRRSQYINNITQSYDTEILYLMAQSDLMQKQFIVDTATELTLSRYEEEYGLPINPQDITIDARRSRIKAKMRVAGVVTKELMQSVIAAWANADVEIVENYADYSFTVKFVNQLGQPPHVNDLYKAVSEIIPAHLGINYVFIYRTHEELGRPSTHKEMITFTHTQLGLKQNNKIVTSTSHTNNQLKSYTHIQLREGVIS